MTKSVSVRTLLFFHCMEFGFSSHSKMHFNLPKPLTLLFTSQSSSTDKEGETCYPDPCLQPGCHSESSLTGLCVTVSSGISVQWGWSRSLVAHSTACPSDPHSLSSRDTEQVLSPGLCLSPTESSSQILSKEPQWFVTRGLPKPAKKRQGLGCPAQFMVKCHLVIQRTQHSDTESQNYTGLFPLPDFQILTPMSHVTENTKILMSPVPEVSALKRKPWYSLTDTEPKWPLLSGDRLISAVMHWQLSTKEEKKLTWQPQCIHSITLVLMSSSV